MLLYTEARGDFSDFGMHKMLPQFEFWNLLARRLTLKSCFILFRLFCAECGKKEEEL